MSRRLVALELITPFVVATLFVLASRHVWIDPNDRAGQISGIAAVEWRLLWFGLPILAIVIAAARGKHFEIVSRFACAAFAGLASATVAAGVYIILRRTQYGLGGSSGDSGILSGWAQEVLNGNGMQSPVYPPLQIYWLTAISKLFGMWPLYALKPFQLIGIACIGPAAYATWRLWFQPAAALFVGVVPSLVCIEAYRPYPMLVLVMMVPVLLKLLQLVRDAGELPLRKLVTCSFALGGALGVLFLLYSGWFQWSAPGFMVATMILFPWKHWRRGLLVGVLSGAIFAALNAHYLHGVAQASAIKDNYFYFDALIEPAYIAMWRGGLPGVVRNAWPPIGELGGVGLFTILMCGGLAVVFAWGRKRTLVVGAGCLAAGTWAFRFIYAKKMAQTKLVQLWPRTTAELVYLTVVLTAFGIYLLIRDREQVRRPNAFLGGFAALLFLFVSSSSTLIEKYMPRSDGEDPGFVAYTALHELPADGNQLIGATVTASSSLDVPAWSPEGAVDGKLWHGFSSEVVSSADREEAIILDMHVPHLFRRFYIYPAPDGMPIDLSIDGWNGEQWIHFLDVRDLSSRSMIPTLIDLGGEQWTDKVRLRATRLRPVANGYAFRFAEIELYR